MDFNHRQTEIVRLALMTTVEEVHKPPCSDKRYEQARRIKSWLKRFHALVMAEGQEKHLAIAVEGQNVLVHAWSPRCGRLALPTLTLGRNAHLVAAWDAAGKKPVPAAVVPRRRLWWISR